MADQPIFDSKNLEYLLKDVKRLIDKSDEISALKHEKFNVFGILRKENDEEKLHSAFIGELLNPSGSHGIGTVFLEHFLRLNKIGDFEDKIGDFDFDHVVECRCEKTAKSFGIIDIYISDKHGNQIAIENKIDAQDGDQQLVRYRMFLNNTQPQSLLFYLNKFGDLPNPISIEDTTQNKRLVLNEDYRIISYHEDILAWLEACLQSSVSIPPLRETIYQYILLVKKLTNQLYNQQMQEELKQTIINNYTTSLSIYSNFEGAEKAVINQFLSGLKSTLEVQFPKDEGWQISLPENLDKKWSCFTLTHQNWPSEVAIRLQASEKFHWGNFCYGVTAKAAEIDRVGLIKSVHEEGNTSNENWVTHKSLFNPVDLTERLRLFNPVQREELISQYAKEMTMFAEKVQAFLTNQ